MSEQASSPELQAAREEALNRHRDAFQQFKQAAERWVSVLLGQKNLALRIDALEKTESAEEEVDRQEAELLKLGLSIIEVADLRRNLAAEK